MQQPVMRQSSIQRIQHLSVRHFSARKQAFVFCALVLLILIAIYSTTLLTRINGGDDPYMDDVGEIQVALNVWGTIHHTGYPLFAILGNLTTTVLRAIGVAAVTAPVLYAMGLGLIALCIFFALVTHLTGKPVVAALAMLLLGLARSIWIHNVISEVYSLSFLFQVLLLAVALWKPVITAQDGRWRTWLLALIGGFGVGHHRMVVFMAPGLILAVWPGLVAGWREKGIRWIAATLGMALLIGLIGFIPYIYLPLRAWAGADWVYNNPGTLAGFWHEFSGAEASFLMKLPDNPQGWIDDAIDTVRILVTELTPLFATLTALSPVWSIFKSRFKREARIVFVCTLGYFWFLLFFHRVVMPQAVAMPIVMMMVLTFTFALDALLETLNKTLAKRIRNRLFESPLISSGAVVAVALVIIAVCVPAQWNFIYTLTHSETGINSIALAKRVPREGGNAVLMLPWGPRYTAVAFSKYVTKENADLPIITHNADIGALEAQGKVIYTSKDTFYRFPLAWWDGQLGRAYLTSAGNEIVAVRHEPLRQTTGTTIAVSHHVTMHNTSYCKTDKEIHITIAWGADQTPDANLSVFVKLLNGEAVIAQADSNAPVYGWYPTTRWAAGEVVYDSYVLPLLPQATDFSFGMYEQKPDGSFVNYVTTKVPVDSLFHCAENG